MHLKSTFALFTFLGGLGGSAVGFAHYSNKQENAFVHKMPIGDMEKHMLLHIE